MAKEDVIVGLDIGTTKICTIIAERTEEDNLKIVGVGTSKSDGLRRGVVVNIEKTVQSITKAVEEAELMAGVEVRGVYAGIAGDHIRSINSKGIIAVSREHTDITKDDVRRVIEAAQAAHIPIEREVIHVIPQEFIVDDQRGIRDPVGMSGIRLEAEVHIVTGAVTTAQNIVKSIHKAGFEVYDLVLEPLAASYAVLSEDEKDLGVAIIDIGGGTSDIAFFSRGSIRHTSVIGLAGDNLTNDIAIGLRTPAHRAKEIKEKYGCALASMVDPQEMISVPSASNHAERQVSRQLLASIIQPRMEEILGLVFREIEDYSDLMAAGIVLAGGTSGLKGIVELTEDLTKLPVRVGKPSGIIGLVNMVDDPKFATGVGLVMYGSQQTQEKARFHGDESSIFNKILERMKQWLTDLW
ncbi:MAG TPA: cell division protein FtsA [archaeon]|nr:cell division protein FtsA [archaeon]